VKAKNIAGAVGAATDFARKSADDVAANTGKKKARNSTRRGVKRNNRAYWRNLRDSWDEGGYGSILSEANRKNIAKGRAPRVDDEWIEWFPGDADLKGEIISPHHIDGGPIAVPLPETRHLDAHMPGGFRYNPGGPGTAG
jgi:filamentous hemagglutinin